MSGWRFPWLPAVLAVLVAFPLWALPHGAVQAAVDDAEFTRLSGPSRYSTSVQIAEAYMDHVDELPDTPQVDTVIMGSGLNEHVGWVAPVPMLSRLHRAPLVFTRPDEVPVPVAQFLQRRAVRRVILLGGTDVISSAVERELASLGVEVIERLGGDDVYLHAVAIAESFDHPAGQLSGKGRTVLLASDTVFADALAAGPMAYQGEFPILLTQRDRLHPAVSDYLIASDIEHVRILGGPQAVGLSVLQTLSGLDFTSDRIQGRDRYGTAVKLAEAQLGGDGLRDCFDGAELGLAFGGLSPDALASGPLLGEQCAPLLLTPADTLPRTVASFLRSDKWVTGDPDNDLAVTVFGGTAVVPTEVVTQFFERATTLVPIGGRISVELDPDDPDMETADEFTVTFDSDIDPKRVPDAVENGLFRINYERVFDGCGKTDNELKSNLLHGCARVSRGRVTVSQLRRGAGVGGSVQSAKLEADDLITVTGGQRIGPNNSPRPIARFSYIIPEPDEPIDRDAPDVEIIAPEGQSQFAVLVIEENPFSPPLHDAAALATRIRVTAADGTAKIVVKDPDVSPNPANGAAGTRASHQRYLFGLDGNMLEPGDAITVPGAVFLDEDGRENPLRRYVVREHSIDFRIESVSIGDVETANQASVVLSDTTQTTQQDALPSGTLRITARRDGIAAGSRGNEWRVYGVGLPPSDDENQDEDGDDTEDPEPDIDVNVNRLSRLIRYRILAGEPTFTDLAEALAADTTFAANFIAEALGVDEDSPTIGGTRTAGVGFDGGGTAVGVRVRFSDPVQTLKGLAAGPRDCLPGDDDAATTDLSKPIPLLADIAPSLNRSGDGCTLNFVAPDNLVYLRLNSASATRLPERGDSVFINGNAASDYPDRPNVAQGWLSIRYDPDVTVD